MATAQEEKTTFRYTADEILQLKDSFYAQQRPINLPDWFQAENDGQRNRLNWGSPFATSRQGTTYYSQPPAMTAARSYPTQLLPKPRVLFRRSAHDLPLRNMSNGNDGFRALRPVSPSAVRPGNNYHLRRIQPWNTPQIAPTPPGFPPQLHFVMNFRGTSSPLANNPPFFF